MPVFYKILNLQKSRKRPLTSRKHCSRIHPLSMFFSASNYPKFNEMAKIRTSAMLTKRCKNETATSIGMP